MGRLCTDFCNINKGMGLLNAVKLILLPRILSRLKIKNSGERTIEKFISDNFSSVLGKYKKCSIPNDYHIYIPNVIWVFWWQGISGMPPVIRVCYESIKRNANGRKVILIDQCNYISYVTLPEYILNKFQKGKISFTHFSDILRVALLKEYGGLWIDAAIFVTKPIPYFKSLFYSPRLSLDLQESPHMSQWVMGVMGTPAKMPLFLYMYDLLLAYWAKYDTVFSYLMFDYFIKYGYNHIYWIRNLISDRPIESPDLHFSRYNFAKKVDNEILDKLLKENTFLSLTYRIHYPKYVDGNKETYYTALLKKYNYDEYTNRGG